MSEVIDVAKKDGRWTECPGCQEIIITRKLDELLWVCPHCDHHFRLPADKRVAMLCDSFAPLSLGRGRNAKSASETAVLGGRALIEDQACILGVMDFAVKGGSMGQLMAAHLVSLMRQAQSDGLPFVIFTATGGVRVQEGIMGLMQMLRTVHVRNSLERSPMITIFTDPTLGGVTASFASLADLMLAEPGARIGFAGPRVIEQTIRQKLPEGFQRAEFLLEHGMIDSVVHRRVLKATVAKILRLLKD
ncbi:MAG: Acetyl-coenzyme A carboxylase carboxyl transferase subunit beta [bacterium ADurb.Bin478]|nr:MAG: Acetyl-coenzyme A carboxylase carboxyl transferase subunit beta [bacterium ADurb.Bin478]